MAPTQNKNLIWPWDLFCVKKVTIDWMHGPRNLTRLVPLKYKPNMGDYCLGPKAQYGGLPVRFSLPSRLQKNLEHFDLFGKPHARMRLTQEEIDTFFNSIISTLYTHLAQILNGQLACYSKTIKLRFRMPITAEGTFACKVARGSTMTALQLDNALILHGRTLFLPFKIV